MIALPKRNLRSVQSGLDARLGAKVDMPVARLVLGFGTGLAALRLAPGVALARARRALDGQRWLDRAGPDLDRPDRLDRGHRALRRRAAAAAICAGMSWRHTVTT